MPDIDFKELNNKLNKGESICFRWRMKGPVEVSAGICKSEFWGLTMTIDSHPFCPYEGSPALPMKDLKQCIEIIRAYIGDSFYIDKNFETKRK